MSQRKRERGVGKIGVWKILHVDSPMRILLYKGGQYLRRQIERGDPVNN